MSGSRFRDHHHRDKQGENGAVYDITVTGTMSLAAGDTYTGSTAYLTKPDGTIIPMFLNVIPPAPGTSENYTARANGVAAMAGDWRVDVKMSYTSGGQNKTAGSFTTFTVP
jgi:hypothetical protein